MSAITLTIRTADRAPQPNYLVRTIESLLAGGVSASAIHVVFTDPDVGWALVPLAPYPVVWHLPATRRSPNANGLAQIDVLDRYPADWLLMLEDDIEVCADFLGSVQRWLAKHAQPDVHVFRFCAFGVSSARRPEVTWYPLREQRGSQAIALRAADARDLAGWASLKGTHWRPPKAPFQDAPDKGFDKLVGYWALDRWPQSRNGYVSQPHFVRHVGRASGLYRQTAVNDAFFAGPRWRYRGAA